MTTYTVDSSGNITPTSPAFPQGTINDQLLPDGSFDQTGVVVFVDNALTLQSLFIGSAIEVDLGQFSSASLTGNGSITGSNDTTKILPAFVSFGGSVVDINGSIDVAYTSNGQVTVSSGERLDLEGDFSGVSASAVTVASGAELDLNSQNSANVSALSSQGTLKITAPNARFVGATTLGGTVTIQGDAMNGVGNGTLATRTTASGNGTYVAALDLRNATLSAPITNLSLLQDAQVSFGTGTTTLQRFTVAGSASALVPLDVVNVDGTLSITGDPSGTNPVSIALAEFGGAGGTVDVNVAAAHGGASLQQRIVVDANTTLRNDGTMSIGTAGTAATTIGATSAAAGSSFINGASGMLTISAGAALSVAALQNAGAISVSGSATFLQGLLNTGTIDISSGALALEGAVQGAGTITVESGTKLSIDGTDSGGIVALRTGGTLSLSQPSTFKGTIQTPSIGATINLAGITATNAVVSNGAIAVTSAAGSFNLAETGLIDGTTVAFGSNGAGGSTLTISANTMSHPSAYRFFDSIHGTQFLTTSLTETQNLQATRPDLVYEGIGLAAANPAIDPAAAPVYRFFDSVFGTHFYTSSASERDTVIATRPDLVSEGIGFYEHTTAQPGDAPVYRFFDKNIGTHFYTADAGERATIIATRPDLISEGVGFYAPSTK